MRLSLPARGTGSAALLFLLAALWQAPPLAAQEQWYSVHLDGRKIGQLHSIRRVDAEGVHGSQRLQLDLERSGEALRIVSEQSTVESLDGLPLAFSSLVDTGAAATRVHGTVADGVAELRLERAGSETTQTLPWPQGALLAEGQRLAALRAGLASGTRYRFVLFDLDALQPLVVENEVIGAVDLLVHGRSESLVALRQQLLLGATALDSELWLEPATLQVRRMRLPALGMHFDVLACDQACAEAPNQPTDVLAATLVQAPRPLSPREREHPLRYRVGYDGAAPLAAAPPGQVRETRADHMLIAVDPRGGREQPGNADDLAATRWLQSDHPELVELAARLAGDAADDASRMQRLRDGVSRHLRVKSLRIGYASALEAARLEEGDCTEHALLLAALGRAQGIPTRVANGLAYAASFSGQRDVFVPHAWVYAWIDGRWQGYDAALPGYGSGHLALELGDGDPFRFYAGIDLLGRLRIESIERIRP